MEKQKPSKGQYIASIILNVIALILVVIFIITLTTSLTDVVNDKKALEPGDQDNTGAGMAAIVLIIFFIMGMIVTISSTVLNVISCIILRCKKDRKWDWYSIVTVVLVFVPLAVWGASYGACQYVAQLLTSM